jgi:DNA primase
MTEIEHKIEVAKKLNLNLLNYPEALAYLSGRGINEDEVKHSNLGFCPPYFSHYVNNNMVLSPLMKGRITVPIKDAYGSIIAFAGRKFEALESTVELAFWQMYNNSPKEAQSRIDQWKRGKWINESFPKKFHLFNLDLAKSEIRNRDYVFVVEGYFDSLTMNSFDLQNNVALCGTRLTDWHATKLSRYCSTVIALLDGDEAGRKALEHIKETLGDVNMNLKVISLPEGYDPDTFLLKFGPKIINKAVSRMFEKELEEINLKL